MRFTLIIECDGAAFEDNPAAEIKMIMNQPINVLADQALRPDTGALFDINGNRVGSWEVTA